MYRKINISKYLEEAQLSREASYVQPATQAAQQNNSFIKQNPSQKSRETSIFASSRNTSSGSSGRYVNKRQSALSSTEILPEFIQSFVSESSERVVGNVKQMFEILKMIHQ